LNPASAGRIVVYVRQSLPGKEELAVMRTVAALFSVVFVLSAAAAAQAPSAQAPVQAPPGATVNTYKTLGADGTQMIVTIVQLPGCPVAMTAKQGGLTEMIKTGQKPPEPQQYEPMPKPSQRIHLILSGFGKGKQVTSATVTARGLSARGRMDRTASGGASDLRRTLDVTFTADEDNTVSAYVDLPAFTSVSSLQLESITYSDGSSWKVPDGRVCRVTPDPVMLIAGR
jgi:hypothetical protein